MKKSPELTIFIERKQAGMIIIPALKMYRGRSKTIGYFTNGHFRLTNDDRNVIVRAGGPVMAAGLIIIMPRNVLIHPLL